jgi:cell division protein FtsL
MKTRYQKQKKRGRQSVFCVLFLFGALISALFLGSARLYGLYLEQRLADCGAKIESVGNEYAMLEKSHASLLSPSRIYNFAKSELNMVTASKVETIKLLSDSYGGSEASRPAGGVAQAPRGLSRILVGTANAKD